MTFFKTIPAEQLLEVGDRVEYGLMPYDGVMDIFADEAVGTEDCMVIAVIDPMERKYKIVDCKTGRERVVTDCNIYKTKRANPDAMMNIEFLVKK